MPKRCTLAWHERGSETEQCVMLAGRANPPLVTSAELVCDDGRVNLVVMFYPTSASSVAVTSFGRSVRSPSMMRMRALARLSALM